MPSFDPRHRVESQPYRMAKDQPKPVPLAFASAEDGFREDQQEEGRSDAVEIHRRLPPDLTVPDHEGPRGPRHEPEAGASSNPNPLSFGPLPRPATTTTDHGRGGDECEPVFLIGVAVDPPHGDSIAGTADGLLDVFAHLSSDHPIHRSSQYRPLTAEPRPHTSLKSRRTMFVRSVRC